MLHVVVITTNEGCVSGRHYYLQKVSVCLYQKQHGIIHSLTFDVVICGYLLWDLHSNVTQQVVYGA